MSAVLLGGIIAFALSLLLTGIAIQRFRAWGLGQEIRDDGPASHLAKRGTPTMGGTAIIASAVIGYFGSKLFTWSAPSISGYLLTSLLVGMGVVGFCDDYLKIYKKRSLGLRAGAKMTGQALVAVGFGFLALSLSANKGDAALVSQQLSFVRDIGPHLGWVLVLGLFWLMVTGTSNATNLTDGLDGLLAGAAAVVFGAYAIIGVWQSNNMCTSTRFDPGCYEVQTPLEVSIFAAAMAGACCGFLWWNASPARIFMGDTGSLALGSTMAGLAILSKTELLLVVLGGLFVMITMSVIVQTTWFKATRRFSGSGKRLFKMAPMQHHFELSGWTQDTVVIRFWILGGISVLAGLAIFYFEWLSH